MFPRHTANNKYKIIDDNDDDDDQVEYDDNPILDTLKSTPITTKRPNCSPACLRSSLVISLVIGTYYVPSISLTFYQHWLLKTFRYPLFIVLVHMCVKYLLAVVIRLFVNRHSRRGIGVRQLPPPIGWREYLIMIAPMGVFSGLDIGLSNWGLELITVSLYTLTKSTTIIFILFFSILFKLERKSWSLVVIVVMITIGLMLFTYKSTEFDLLGFLLLLFASACSGIRWTCVQMLLQKAKMGMKTPVDMIYHMQPWMMLSVLPFALAIEGPKLLALVRSFGNSESDGDLLLATTAKILFGALIAFFMEFAEVTVVGHTSSLTLSIAGIFKDFVQLAVAVEWYDETMSAINVLGLIVCLCGIVCHIVHKLRTGAISGSTTVTTVTNSFQSSNGRYYGESGDVGEHLMMGSREEDDEEDAKSEKSDSQVLFDILNSRDR